MCAQRRKAPQRRAWAGSVIWAWQMVQRMGGGEEAGGEEAEKGRGEGWGGGFPPGRRPGYWRRLRQVGRNRHAGAVQLAGFVDGDEAVARADGGVEVGVGDGSIGV